ncbi:MAG: RHS repeat domain-containing protein [Candidatus Limnocylindria bacterium]
MKSVQGFNLDAEGNRTQLVESGALGDLPPGPSDTFSYEYDGLSRLLEADAVLFGGGIRSETFSYDAATNIQARTGPAATYTMDGANRVTSDGAQAFTWDGADRLVQRGADTFSYDPLSRLTAATVAGATTSYQYDGDGLLAIRTGSSGSTNFVWDSSVAPAPLLEAGSDRVVHGLGPLYLARADGSTIRLVRDALGSVRAELDDLGLVTKSFRYAAYGSISDRFPSDATPTLLGFTGELADSSGLTYLRARWYDPVSGRFTSRDPFIGNVHRPASLNAYGYAAGRPSLLVDPLGLDPERSKLGIRDRGRLCGSRLDRQWHAPDGVRQGRHCGHWSRTRRSRWRGGRLSGRRCNLSWTRGRG